MAVKAREYRTVYQDVSAQAEMSAGVDPSATIVAAKAKHSVFVQEIRVHITTDAAVTLTFQDTTGTHAPIFVVPASPGTGEYRFRPQGEDDQGLQLPEDAGLDLVASAAGFAGWWEVDCYRRITAVAITPDQI